nr:purple acid phosphatase 3-like [Tanacetum cinerariifolium]
MDVALKESTAQWKIVVGHHTIFSAGKHGNTQELVDKLLPILQANEVDYMNGHDQCLQQISRPTSQLQFLTSGGGSKAWYGAINPWNPYEIKFYYDGQSFMAVEIIKNEAYVMVESGLEPTLKTYNVILNGCLIRGLCHVGQMDKAIEYLDRMKHNECEPNVHTYNVIISGMFGRKRFDDLVVAGKLLIEMVDRGFIPRKFSFNRILNGLWLTLSQDFAKEILRAQSRRGHLPRLFRAVSWISVAQ